jgi:hypothetical protein
MSGKFRTTFLVTRGVTGDGVYHNNVQTLPEAFAWAKDAPSAESACVGEENDIFEVWAKVKVLHTVDGHVEAWRTPEGDGLADKMELEINRKEGSK